MISALCLKTESIDRVKVPRVPFTLPIDRGHRITLRNTSLTAKLDQETKKSFGLVLATGYGY